MLAKRYYSLLSDRLVLFLNPRSIFDFLNVAGGVGGAGGTKTFLWLAWTFYIQCLPNDRIL